MDTSRLTVLCSTGILNKDYEMHLATSEQLLSAPQIAAQGQVVYICRRSTSHLLSSAPVSMGMFGSPNGLKPL
jgi:hypothetical protein